MCMRQPKQQSVLCTELEELSGRTCAYRRNPAHLHEFQEASWAEWNIATLRMSISVAPGLSGHPHLFRVVLLVAVGAEPGVSCRKHLLQLQAVAHQQARPAEAPLRRVAAAALRLPCIQSPFCSDLFPRASPVSCRVQSVSEWASVDALSSATLTAPAYDGTSQYCACHAHIDVGHMPCWGDVIRFVEVSHALQT